MLAAGDIEATSPLITSPDASGPRKNSEPVKAESMFLVIGLLFCSYPVSRVSWSDTPERYLASCEHYSTLEFATINAVRLISRNLRFLCELPDTMTSS